MDMVKACRSWLDRNRSHKLTVYRPQIDNLITSHVSEDVSNATLQLALKAVALLPPQPIFFRVQVHAAMTAQDIHQPGSLVTAKWTSRGHEYQSVSDTQTLRVLS